MSVSAVDSLLIRIQSKIESRTRRPWFDLQRGYFYKSNNGIKNIPELKAALEHYHVLLSEPDYHLLFQSFPKSDNSSSFDFRSFASRLYPKESNIKIVRDGRWIDDIRAKSQQIISPDDNEIGQGRHISGIYYPAGEGQQFYSNPPAGATIYDEKTQSFVTIPGGQQQNLNGMNGALMTAGGNIIGNDLDYPVLGETLGPSGTTTYYTTPGGINSSHNAKHSSDPSSNSSSSIGLSSTSGTTSKRNRLYHNSQYNPNYRPKITYNRPIHQRFAETVFDDYTSHEPVSQGYPEEEYKTHGRYKSSLDRPRFARRQTPKLVEVARRHNISRQYNRDGKNKIARKDR